MLTSDSMYSSIAIPRLRQIFFASSLQVHLKRNAPATSIRRLHVHLTISGSFFSFLVRFSFLKFNCDHSLRNIDNTCYVNATLQALFAKFRRILFWRYLEVTRTKKGHLLAIIARHPMAVLSSSEICNLDVDMARMYRRAMDVQGRKCATRVRNSAGFCEILKILRDS
jgi:hypothetical protein